MWYVFIVTCISRAYLQSDLQSTQPGNINEFVTVPQNVYSTRVQVYGVRGSQQPNLLTRSCR